MKTFLIRGVVLNSSFFENDDVNERLTENKLIFSKNNYSFGDFKIFYFEKNNIWLAGTVVDDASQEIYTIPSYQLSEDSLIYDFLFRNKMNGAILMGNLPKYHIISL